MIKIVKWVWTLSEDIKGTAVILFNHIEIQKGQWSGWLWNIAKPKKQINFYLGKIVISFIKDDYKTYFADHNIAIQEVL
jgi:hypothetical protein